MYTLCYEIIHTDFTEWVLKETYIDAMKKLKQSFYNSVAHETGTLGPRYKIRIVG